MDSGALLERLCEAHGPSGYEDEVRLILEELVTPYVDEIRTDALGNLIVRRNADRSQAPTLMIDAHMDEVGFVVSHIASSGFVFLAPVGGWDERVLPGHRVQLSTRDREKIFGVIGTVPPHIQGKDDKRAPFPLESLFVDIGARNDREVALRGLRIGDSAVLYQPFRMLTDDVLSAKAFDDRVGCAILVQLLEALAQEERLPYHIVGVFSCFEETGARGAAVAAYEVAPTLALVLEATVAADVPNVPESRCPSRLGEGPVLTLMDKYTHCHPRLVRFLEAIAEDLHMPFQFKRPIFGGTNAARIHISRKGVPTATISVPCRYIHSAAGILRMSDYENARQLVLAFVKRAGSLFESW